jgi:hypothetical protein
MNTKENDAPGEGSRAQDRRASEERQRPPAGEPEHSTGPGADDELERTLDDALADSFPASDPVSIVTSQHEEAWDRKRSEGEEPKRSD